MEFALSDGAPGSGEEVPEGVDGGEDTEALVRWGWF
jgi:hypothetical protein